MYRGLPQVPGRPVSRRVFHGVGLGFLFPTLPNGGWSITVEAHFYLLLPLLLLASRRFVLAPLLFIAAAIVLRSILYVQIGEVQSAASLTIIGHADQFLAGILAFHLRAHAKNQHWLALAVLMAFFGVLLVVRCGRRILPTGAFSVAPLDMDHPANPGGGSLFIRHRLLRHELFQEANKSAIQDPGDGGGLQLFDLSSAPVLRHAIGGVHRHACHEHQQFLRRMPLVRIVLRGDDPDRLSQLHLRRGAIPAPANALCGPKAGKRGNNRAWDSIGHRRYTDLIQPSLSHTSISPGSRLSQAK
ncbi:MULTISPECIES: hypothetical protein [unclassified Mesorhizobium]|uniref:hypothetical protein n=1 Tax=unclassified Mesorhizobium TaxID=325217 RepID=UPI003335DDD3